MDPGYTRNNNYNTNISICKWRLNTLNIPIINSSWLLIKKPNNWN